MIANETASGHEGDMEDSVTASGHRKPPGEQGNAHADDVIGSCQKTATGIDPKIETGLPENDSARGRTATEKTTASDALDLLTANGKRARTTATVPRAVRPRASSAILPCSSLRRTGNTGVSSEGAVLRNFSRLIMSRSVV